MAFYSGVKIFLDRRLFFPLLIYYIQPDRMAERDVNKEALENVEKATESEPVKGEDLVESENLKRQFREAKERLAKSSGGASSSQDVS